MPELDTKTVTQLIGDLADHRYAVAPDALPPALVTGLRACALKRKDFRAARVGRTGHSNEAPLIRNDEISWINETELAAAEKELFNVFESLRLELNRELFLGLTDFEAHYARYEAGHFYERHVDRFQADGARVVSVVVYLNENWGEADGGELRLHVSPPLDLQPINGTLVCFMSDTIEHEVRKANRERLSIAAWFRRTPSGAR